MNCGIRITTEEGRWLQDNAVEVIEEFISMQYDKYGFNPYELSDEQTELLTKDTTFQKYFLTRSRILDITIILQVIFSPMECSRGLQMWRVL